MLQNTWLDLCRFPSSIFKVKYEVCFISAQNDPTVMNQKENLLIELYASNWTIRFDPDHDPDLEF